MSKFKVYISDYDYPDNEIEKSILEPIGAQVIALKCRTGEGLADLAADADAILQQYAKIGRDTIERLTKCKIIARYGVGVDILDVAACREKGILVTNVPDYCIDEVADHAISFSFMLMRNLSHYNQCVHKGSYRWQDWIAPIPRYRGAEFGMIAFGRIAQNAARKLQVFGFRVSAYDPFVSESFMASHGVRKMGLDELLEQSDVVNVFSPYTKQTHHIINAETLAKMKSSAYLVCVSRGKCVDNRALYEALKNGIIAGAALDDPEEEPMKMENWSPSMNPLFALDNCFITPHSSYVSKQSLEECRRVASENVKAALLGQQPFDLYRGV
ncbi:MAG TPA: C-terminal binding protein [Anaerovoracaceae bacterium]|nr:C-terminal binding protein [Anaerovoracaceae bacterium]